MKDIKKVKLMNVFCYARVANSESLSQENQYKSTRMAAEQLGFHVINTGCSNLDRKMLSLVTTKIAKLNEAVITFRV